MKIVRRIAAVAGVLVLLIVVAVVLAVVFVKPDRIKQIALDRARESTGYAITAGPASLKLGFSGVGVRVDSLRLASPDSSQLVSIDKVDVYAKLMPLLRRRVELRDAVLHRPVITVAEPRETPSPGGAAGPSEEPAASTMLLALESWTVKEGTYRQAGSWGHIQLDGLDVVGSFSWDPKAGGRGSAEGTVRTGSLEGAAGRFPIPAFDAEADFRMPASGDSIGVPRAEVRSGRIEAVLSGAYWQTDTGWDGRLEVEAEPFAWDDLRELAPPGSLAETSDLEIGGIFELSRLVIETRSRNATSVVTGQLLFADVTLKSPESPLGFSAGKGTVRFSPDAVEVVDGTGRVGDDPVRFSLKLEGDELKDVHATVAADLSAANLSRVMPADAPLRLERGAVGIDLSLAERLPLEPGQVPAISGLVTLGGLGGRFRELAVTDLGGRIRLDGASAEVQSLQGSLGASDFLLRGRVTDLATPVLAFTLDCKSLDLDELMEATKPGSGDGSGAGADGGEPSKLVGLPLDGRVKVEKLVYREMAAQGVSAHVALDAEGLVVDEVEAKLHGGSAKGELRAKPGSDLRTWTYQGHLDLDDIGVGPVLSSFTRYGSRVEGKTIARIKVGGTAGPGIDALRDLTLKSDLKVRDGAFRNVEGLIELARGLKIKEAIQERWPFRNLSGAVAVRQGALVIDTLRIVQKQVDWTFGGTIGLDGRLGLRGTASADPAFVTLPPEAELLAPYLEDDAGRIPIDFRLGGSFDSPKASLDWEAALLRATEKAKSEPREKLKDKIKETLDDPNALDKLKKLFGRGG